MQAIADRCEACGAAVANGSSGCQQLINELMAQAQLDMRFGGVYRLAFDAYCMQHPEKYCVSAKSYAAHLMGLCHGVEHEGDPATYWRIPRWLNGPARLDKPPLLRSRGTTTIADVHGAATPEDHARRVRAWAEAVWAAYAPQHALARDWLRQAMGELR
jgi:Family of unknown function (DUF5946)